MRASNTVARPPKRSTTVSTQAISDRLVFANIQPRVVTEKMKTNTAVRMLFQITDRIGGSESWSKALEKARNIRKALDFYAGLRPFALSPLCHQKRWVYCAAV
tara:strand:- start:2899 stop:3207 length:309 start_codon:yes stop_codon:yes gene_type:complete